MDKIIDSADAAPFDEAELLATDRRKNERQIATFRTCCVVLDGAAHPGILRNMSAGGAMIEALASAPPGTHITYWWDGIEPVEARVAWVDGNRMGVANLSGPASPVDVPAPRATRVPVRLPVRIWKGSNGQWVEMADISMSGIAVQGLRGIAPGALCTIELSGQTLHNASIVRTDDGITGIRFERPLSPARLMHLLEGSEPAGRTPPPAEPPCTVEQAPEAEPERGAEPERHVELTATPAPIRRFL